MAGRSILCLFRNLLVGDTRPGIGRRPALKNYKSRMENLPKKVQKFRPARSGKCPPMAFILIAVLSPAGFWLGLWLAEWVIDLIHLDFILLTLFLIVGGTMAGAVLGNVFGGYCRNLFLLSVALIPTLLYSIVVGVEMFMAIEFGSPGLSDSLGGAEAIFIAATPIGVLLLMRGEHFCEKCQKAYETDKTLWTSSEVEPTEWLSALTTQTWLPDKPADKEAKFSDKYVTLTSDFCPECFDAAVHATLSERKAEKKGKVERLVYSAHWPGERFKALREHLRDKEAH